jgi:hypothetical protein
MWMVKKQRRTQKPKRKPTTEELINSSGAKKLRKLEVDGYLFILDIDPHSIKRLKTKYLEQGVDDVRGFIDGAFMTLCVNLEDDDKEKIPYALRSKVLEYAGILKGVI